MQHLPPPDASPFPDNDPLSVSELDPEQLAWRITLHLLAVTGRFVHVPPGLCVNSDQLQIAAGWAYRPHIRPASDGGLTISCERTGWTPTTPQSLTGNTAADTSDPYANALTVTALPDFARPPTTGNARNGHPHSGATGQPSTPPDDRA